MIFARFRRDKRDDTISALYGTIVAQARTPCFYRDFRVDDTVNGRFDLLVAHVALVLRRMMPDPALNDLGQGLFDRFCRDMDHNLREMGISDLKVPKEMRRMGEAYYGRAQAYDAAYVAADPLAALTDAVERNIYGGTAPDQARARQLASYLRSAATGLAAQTPDTIAGGTLTFPDPLAAPIEA